MTIHGNLFPNYITVNIKLTRLNPCLDSVSALGLANLQMRRSKGLNLASLWTWQSKTKRNLTMNYIIITNSYVVLLMVTLR